MKKGFLTHITHIMFLLACTSSGKNYSIGVATVSEPETQRIRWSYSIGCKDLGFTGSWT